MRLQRLAADQVHDAEASGIVETDLRALVGHEDDVIVTIERRAFAIGPTLDDHHASGHAEVAKQPLAVIELQQHVLGPALDALHPAPLEARREVLRQRELGRAQRLNSSHSCASRMPTSAYTNNKYETQQ